MVTDQQVDQLEQGHITQEELAEILKNWLYCGEEPIAGIKVVKTGEVMSIYEAQRRGILMRGTALELLEAQAATGKIVDPATGERYSVDDAFARGLFDRRYVDTLKRAERAITGYVTADGKTLSLFQAMSRGRVAYTRGIRLLEAQIATGGLIDPKVATRVPINVAFERGLFQEDLYHTLQDPTDDTKGFFDPNTGENLTYLQLIQRCPTEEIGSSKIRLLQIKEKGDRGMDSYIGVSQSQNVSEMYSPITQLKSGGMSSPSMQQAMLSHLNVNSINNSQSINSTHRETSTFNKLMSETNITNNQVAGVNLSSNLPANSTNLLPSSSNLFQNMNSNSNVISKQSRTNSSTNNMLVSNTEKFTSNTLTEHSQEVVYTKMSDVQQMSSVTINGNTETNMLHEKSIESNLKDLNLEYLGKNLPKLEMPNLDLPAIPNSLMDMENVIESLKDSSASKIENLESQTTEQNPKVE